MSMQTDRVGSARLSATEVKIAHAMAELISQKCAEHNNSLDDLLFELDSRWPNARLVTFIAGYFAARARASGGWQ